MALPSASRASTGRSALRRYQIGETQAPDTAALPPELFAEGICRVGEHIWQLTWRERVALRWDARSLTLLETISYNREGWGICTAGDQVLTTDGSSELVVRDPATLQPLSLIMVRCGGRRVGELNDLAWAGGRIWANIAQRPYLAGIDPASGEVVDIVDAKPAGERHRDPEAILNGITALPAPGEFLLTGKRYKAIYHVRLAEGRTRKRPDQLLAGPA